MGCELAPKEAPEGLALGTFAGGCFWGLELAMQRVPGVVATSSGYTQGDVPNPTYELVCSGRSGHTEAVQVCLSGVLNAYHSCNEIMQLNSSGNFENSINCIASSLWAHHRAHHRAHHWLSS